MSADIRRARAGDVPEMARLLTMLGHPTGASSLAERWKGWTAANNSALVATGPGDVLHGLATLHTTIVLHRPRPLGRITALVVDERVRGQGIGRRLVAAAESALAAEGCGLLEVTSNLRLVDAHAFYERLGYERTSVRFQKVLGG